MKPQLIQELTMKPKAIKIQWIADAKPCGAVALKYRVAVGGKRSERRLNAYYTIVADTPRNESGDFDCAALRQKQSEIATAVERLHEKIVRTEGACDAERLARAIVGKDSPRKSHTLAEILQLRADADAEKYRRNNPCATWAKYWQPFADIPAERTSRAVLIRFYEGTPTLSHNTRAQAIGFALRALRWAMEREILPEFALPVSPYKVRTGTKIEHYLSDDQIHQIETLKPLSRSARTARDLFLFQYHTGLAYIDTQTFRYAEHVQPCEGLPDRYMLVKRRQKTGTEAVVLLSAKAMEILARYGYKLPIMSYNAYYKHIKNIAKLAGLPSWVSAHTPRHSAAMQLLNKGVRMEVVAAFLGNDVACTIQFYAKMQRKKILQELTAAER